MSMGDVESRCDHCTALWETDCSIRKGGVLSDSYVQSISFIIFLIVTITRFTTSYYVMHYTTISRYI